VIGKRVYIETMGEILSKIDKIVLDSEAASNLLPDILLDCLPRTREALHKNGERREPHKENASPSHPTPCG